MSLAGSIDIQGESRRYTGQIPKMSWVGRNDIFDRVPMMSRAGLDDVPDGSRKYPGWVSAMSRAGPRNVPSRSW
jgi:hypothetical protein